MWSAERQILSCFSALWLALSVYTYFTSEWLNTYVGFVWEVWLPAMGRFSEGHKLSILFFCAQNIYFHV